MALPALGTLTTVLPATVLTTAYAGATATIQVREVPGTFSIIAPRPTPSYSLLLYFTYVAVTSDANLATQIEVSPDGGTTYFVRYSDTWTIASPVNGVTYKQRLRIVPLAGHEAYVKVSNKLGTASGTSTMQIQARLSLATLLTA